MSEKMSDKRPVLEVRNLSVALPKGADRVHAVEKVSFTVNPGEIVCLVGESGSGKSVIAFTVMGLLAKALKPTGGEILLEGENILAASEARLLAEHAHHAHIAATPDMAYRFPVHAPANLPARPVVVGFGPCGMFAALLLAQMGFKPLVLERGPSVRQRTKDTWDLWRKNTLHVQSNVQFGEGGAGTFSDGKIGRASCRERVSSPV